MKCVLAASGKDVVSTCITNGIMQAGEEPDTKSDYQLAMLGPPAKQVYRDTGAFPKGHAGPTPSRACCSYPDHRCPVSHDWT